MRYVVMAVIGLFFGWLAEWTGHGADTMVFWVIVAPSLVLLGAGVAVWEIEND